MSASGAASDRVGWREFCKAYAAHYKVPLGVAMREASPAWKDYSAGRPISSASIPERHKFQAASAPNPAAPSKKEVHRKEGKRSADEALEERGKEIATAVKPPVAKKPRQRKPKQQQQKPPPPAEPAVGGDEDYKRFLEWKKTYMDVNPQNGPPPKSKSKPPPPQEQKDDAVMVDFFPK